MNWRNRALLKRIRELPCAFDELSHECFGVVVPCHSNQIRDGKGVAVKAHDYRVAAGCVNAHHEIDSGHSLSHDERVELWEAAHRRTIGYLFDGYHLILSEK